MSDMMRFPFLPLHCVDGERTHCSSVELGLSSYEPLCCHRVWMCCGICLLRIETAKSKSNRSKPHLWHRLIDLIALSGTGPITHLFCWWVERVMSALCYLKASHTAVTAGTCCGGCLWLSGCSEPITQALTEGDCRKKIARKPPVVMSSMKSNERERELQKPVLSHSSGSFS